MPYSLIPEPALPGHEDAPVHDYLAEQGDVNFYSDNDDQEDYSGNEDDDAYSNYQDENEEDYFEIGAEDEQDYRPGGLHPVHLDDRLGPNGRYRVVHKLGFGGHGTVWLCHDAIENRWRAVKILAADLGGPEKCKELETANQLLGRCGLEAADGLQMLLERHHIALPVYHFTIDGPNGTHLALVYPLLGSSVADAFQLCAPHPELLKDLCFQLVQAMDFLHRNGRCHGDFRPANILLRLVDGVDQWPEEKLLNILGEPKTGPLLQRDPAEPGASLPEYLISTARFDYTSGLLLTSAAVSDFGVSFDARDPPLQTSIPPPRAAPEDMITGIASPGCASDVWTLMHTIMEVRLGKEKAFMAPDGQSACYEADKIAYGPALNIWESTTVMGPMPKKYRDVWRERGGFFVNGHEDDEHVPVVAHARTLETRRTRWAERTGVLPGDYLKFRLMDEFYTLLDKPLWDAVAGQDYQATGLLPRLPYHSTHWMMQDHVSCKLDPIELEQFYDLCTSVYRWQPQERALTGRILNHLWFGDRNKRESLEDLGSESDVAMDEVKGNTKTPGDSGTQEDGATISTPEEDMEETTPILDKAYPHQGYGAVASQEVAEKDQSGISPSPPRAVLSPLS